MGVERLKESTKSNYKAVIRTLYRKYKNAEIDDGNEIFKMLEGKRYKATESYKRIRDEGGIRRFKEEAKNRGHRVEEALEYVLEVEETLANADKGIL
jgi:hypothetical protein